MEFAALYLWRKAAGLVGAVILCLALAFAVDGMVAGGRANPNAFDLLPGQDMALSDTMPRGAATLSDLAPEVSDPRLRLSLTETFSGFWLGGTMWRGRLSLPQDMPQGDYAVTMRYQNGTESAPRQTFTIHVRKDEAAVRAASLSLTTRTFGLRPYAVAAGLVPLALLPMAACFVLTRRIGRALRLMGMAEVYRAMASEGGQRIFFSPPGAEELDEGAPVQVLDERGGRELGRALVVAVTGPDVEAVMQDGGHVRPGCLARVV